MQVDSSWSGGWCGKFVVQNIGATPASLTRISFGVPAGASVTSTWNGTVSGTGTSRVITLPSWASAPGGGTYSDTGLCVSGTQTLANVTVEWSGGSATTPSPAPAPTPTPTPTPAPTPAPAPGSPALTATVNRDSTWATGFCRSFTVANNGTAASASWRLTFTLPAGVAITQSWSGTPSAQTGTVTVTPADWAAAIAPGAKSTSFGFCASGTGDVSATTVIPVS